MEIRMGKSIVLGILLAFFLGMGTMYAWQSYNKFKTPPFTQPSLKPSSPSIVKPSPQTQIPSNWETYRSEKGNFEFRYPAEVITASESGRKILLTHSIDYKHPDPCDFRDNVSPLRKLTDFKVSIEVFDSGLKEAIAVNEGDYFISDFFLDDKLKVEPNFIDEFYLGSLEGYRITTGVEGCGQYSYYFPLNPKTTLIVIRSFITEFKPIVTRYEKYLNLPGIISPTEEEKLFNQILSTFKFNSLISIVVSLL